MTPVYFPFTYASERSLRLLGSVFNKIGIYSITGETMPPEMKKYQQSGFLQIIQPEGIDPEEFEISMNEYRDFWHLHQGSDLAITVKGLDNIPFYDETAVSKIRSDIRGGVKGSEGEKDPVLEKLLFLRVAHEFDLEQAEISTGLSELDKIENKLFHELKGELAVKSEGGGHVTADEMPPKDNEPESREYKPLSRLKSWSCLFQKGVDLTTGVYVTDSRPVIDHLKETTNLRHAITIESIPLCEKGEDADMALWRERLSDALSILEQKGISDSLEACADIPHVEGAGTRVSMDIFITPGNPAAFFGSIAGNRDLSFDGEPEINHTVILFISWSNSL